MLARPLPMGIRISLIYLLLALATVADPSMAFDHEYSLTHIGDGIFAATASGGCDAALGECFEEGEEGMPSMESEITRRMMAQGGRHISYGALRGNSVPCSRRGYSYYNCIRSGRANPYRRGCSRITRCSRNTN